MVRRQFVTFALALAATSTAVPAEAETFRDFQVSERPAGFMGLNFRLPLGRAVKPEPAVRLQATMLSPASEPSTASTPYERPRGLEIGLARNGRPSLFIHGQNLVQAQTRLGLSGASAGTPLLIGGAILAVAVVAVVAGGGGVGDTCPTVGGSRDHCINP